MIGRMIEAARIHKGWSRENLASRTNGFVSEATIKRLERRRNYRISNEKLLAVLNALDLEIGLLQQNEIQRESIPKQSMFCLNCRTSRLEFEK